MHEGSVGWGAEGPGREHDKGEYLSGFPTPMHECLPQCTRDLLAGTPANKEGRAVWESASMDALPRCPNASRAAGAAGWCDGGLGADG